MSAITPVLVVLLAVGQMTMLPARIRAWDTPNDKGGSITIEWQSDNPTEPDFWVLQRTQVAADTTVFEVVPAGVTSFRDEGTLDRQQYQYRVGGVYGADTVWSEITAPVTSSPQFFNTSRINILIGILVFSTLVVYYINQAKAGKKQLFVRRITGLDAVEEAIGRATEMGRAIVYVPGIGGVDGIATIASINILGEVARKVAQYDSRLIVPCADPIVFTVMREVAKEAYTRAGRPDAYRPEDIFFVTDHQFAFAAAVDGLMVREKPATNFFLGGFAAESLILAETGATTGAIQIAGTDGAGQLPFFIAACDYTLIGEELYAASAYLSREPLFLGSLKGQDYGKLIILVVVSLSSILLLLSRFPALRFLSHVAGFFGAD